MDPETLFGLALGLTPPWQVRRIEFSTETARLDIYLDFPRGATFHCPACGVAGAKAYDTAEEVWRHLNFFQYAAYLHARLPRVQCPGACGIKTVAVPWARPDSGFTRLFEALIMVLAREMPVAAMAALLGEHDTRLWRVIHHYVEQARAQQDYSAVRQVGMDETASRRGHQYVSLFVDLERAHVLFATEGKDASTVEAFKTDLEAHGGLTAQVTEVACDMSPAFIAGVQAQFPSAQITFDKFHLLKLLNEAVDQVRREEQKSCPELKRSRYVWLTNPPNLTAAQQATLGRLKDRKLKTVRAYHLRLTFQEFWTQPVEQAEGFLRRWFFWATHSRLQPMREAAYTIKCHWDGVLRWFTSHINTGVLEGINSLVQAAKAMARGYRTTRNLIAMVYLIAGKLKFALPT
jgi:transposase